METKLEKILSDLNIGLITVKDARTKILQLVINLKYNIMETTRISREDVYDIANQLSMEVTNEQVTYVMENYDSEEDQDETAGFDLIIENLLYGFIN